MTTIRQFKPDDFLQVQAIYKQGIETQNATFQQHEKTWEEWESSMLPTCRLVAVDQNQIAGWAGLSATSSREVYAGVCEVSIYINSQFQGQGVGSLLMSVLIDESEQQGIWTLQAGIFPENKASIALHKKHGFRIIGHRERVGQMHGIWRDSILMERRSKIVGLD